ncbi:MAG: tRNA (guanosine(46)-N7)-methyltransferase TrmB [Actinomycetes bacterium]
MKHPHIRTFGARHGRMSAIRERAITELMPLRSLDRFEAPVNLATETGAAVVFVDFGCGMGDHTLELARSRPDHHILAMDVHTAGISQILNLVEAENLTNISVFLGDGIDLLKGRIAAESITEFHVLFPDPWPKARQQKRRVLQLDFLTLLHPILQNSGWLRFVTDDDSYASHVAALIPQQDFFRLVETDWRVPSTRYHRRALDLGNLIHVFNLQKI